MVPGFGPKPPSSNEPEPEWELTWTLDDTDDWRFEQLREAGWPHMDAVRLAIDHNVDLHRACDLLRQGCDPDVAMELLT